MSRQLPPGSGTRVTRDPLVVFLVIAVAAATILVILGLR